MRRLAQTIAMLEQPRQESHPGERNEHVVRADDRGVAREHEEQRSRHRHVIGEEGAGHVRGQQGHELVGVRVPAQQRGRP